MVLDREVDKQQLKDFNKRGTRLICKSCTTENEERLRALKPKVARSKWKCRCGKPVHHEKCKLSPSYFGEQRWPGNGTRENSEDDAQFLNTHKPDWWQRALGKK